MLFSFKSTKARISLLLIFTILLFSACNDWLGGSAFSTRETQGGSAGSDQDTAIAGETGEGGSANTTPTKSTGGVQSTSSTIVVTTAGANAQNFGTGGSITCPNFDLDAVKLEANYIRACQYLPTDKTDPAYGAINRSYGGPTNVVPAEVALAGIGLIEASKLLNDSTYLDSANSAGDYLVRIHDELFGGWYDEYNQATASVKSMSVRQAALTIIFLNKLGYQSARAKTLIWGGQYILTVQSVQNKGGLDDGLVCEGRDATTAFSKNRWISDNVLAYHALNISATWAETAKDTASATEFRNTATRLLAGIKTSFLDSSMTHWKRVIDPNGIELSDSAMTIDWISYSPAIFNLPLGDVSINTVGESMHQNLQINNGAVAWDNASNRSKQSPLYTFQANLVWKKSGQCQYANSAFNWAMGSGLWQKTPDAKGITGGWIDWSEPSGNRAVTRSVATSTFAILNASNNFTFSL